MTSLDYQVLSRRIYSNFPVIGWLLRRWAAWQLAKDDGSGEAVAILAEVVTRSRDRAVREMALAVLNRLRTQDAINGFCRVWVETRHEDLTEILRSRRYVATEMRLRVLSALKVGALDVVKRGGVEVLDFLLAALNDRDTQVATVAASCVSALENRVVIDELCRRWVESRSSQLEGIIRQGGYVASQPVAVRVLTALKLNQIQEISDGGIEVLDCVLKAFDDRDMEVVRSANVCAVSLTNRGAIDELCKRWASSRNKQLEQIICQGGYIASQPIEFRVLVALRFDHFTKIESDGEKITIYLLAALDDNYPSVVKAAYKFLNSLQNKEIIDGLCKKWMENSDNRLQEIIRTQNYEPQNLITKALFYFLLGEWQKYEDLDFDQSLLLKAYQTTNSAIKRRFMDKARESGRAECIRVLTHDNKGFNVDGMTSNDWNSLVNILVANPNRNNIWNFFYNAPPVWSRKLLKVLNDGSCKWFKENEETLINRLCNLAENAAEEDFKTCLDLQEELIYKQLKISPITGKIYISPDSQILFVETNPEIFDLWSLPKGNYLKEIPLRISSIAFSPNSNFFITISCDVDINVSEKIIINLWSLPEINNFKSVKYDCSYNFSFLHGYPRLQVTPNGKTLVVKTEHSGIDLWSLPELNYIANISENISGIISPDSQLLLIRNNWYSLQDGTLQCSIQIHNSETNYWKKLESRPCTFIDNGKILVASNYFGFTLWNIQQNNQPQYILSSKMGKYGMIECISPDGKFLASTEWWWPKGKNRVVDVYNLLDYSHYKTLLGHHTSYELLAISSDNQLLAAVNLEETTTSISLWNLQDNNYLRTIDLETSINYKYYSRYQREAFYLYFSPDNHSLIFHQYYDRKGSIIHLWNLPDGNLWKFTDGNIPLSKFTAQDISKIESKIKDKNLDKKARNVFEFTLALIRLRQQFDIDIEDVSSDVQFSEFDIEIDG